MYWLEVQVCRVEKEGRLERANRTSKATSSGWNLGGIPLGLEAPVSKGVGHRPGLDHTRKL